MAERRLSNSEQAAKLILRFTAQTLILLDDEGKGPRWRRNGKAVHSQVDELYRLRS